MDEIHKKYVYTYRGETFPHRIEVKIRGDGFLELNEWIEKTIKGRWTDISTNRGYFMEFELEEDAVAFKLRWI